MGSRPLKVSPSILGLRSQAPKEDAILPSNVPFPPKSPFTSLVSKTAVHVGVPDNGFTTPRSRSRSAIYSMARTPYSRVYSTASQKGTKYTNSGYGGSPSSSLRTWEHDGELGSKQLAIKRRSSVLDDDIGSVGSMRRIRQKPNLLSQRVPLSTHGVEIGSDPAQHPASSTKNLIFNGENKDKVSKTVSENDDSSFASTSYASVPSKSSEIATKILQHLEKLTPKKKSLESKLAAARMKSAVELTPNLLHGQALRSMENADSSRLLQNSQDGCQMEDFHNNSLPDARDSSSQRHDKVEENGPKKFAVPCDTLTPAVNGDSTVSVKDGVPAIRTADSSITKHVTQPLQKKRAFQMSAHEDSLEMDADIYLNRPSSVLLAEGRGIQETTEVESNSVSSEVTTLDKAGALPKVKTSVDPALDKRTGLETAYGSVVGDKIGEFHFPTSHAPSTSFQPAVLSQSAPAFGKITSPKEANGPPTLFSFISKNVDKVPPFAFNSSSSVDESSGPKSSAWSVSKPKNSLANEASGRTDTELKILESDNDDNKNTRRLQI
ncbi:unnamed protein product [Ilex paraguariensis]|uniref:Uncharacterized protein n=1 Tax=Ilex paraguariensis TaxID=185542 RepID=A0ABC8UIT7_9AQUA